MRIIRSFEGQNIPKFPIVLSGPLTNVFGKHSFEAGMDTGFTGFLSIPLLAAVKAGLILGGVMPLTLADGKSQSFLYCLGAAETETKSAIGVTVISPSDDVLIGMEFLRLLGLRLIVDPISKTAILTDEDPPIQLPDQPNNSSS
jgi:predicted aspartyl protease